VPGDLTACFALGNVFFALGTKSCSTSQPQWIHLNLTVILGRAGFVTQALRSTWVLLHMRWENAFTYGLATGISKTITRQSSSSEWLSSQGQRSGTAQKEFPVS